MRTRALRTCLAPGKWPRACPRRPEEPIKGAFPRLKKVWVDQGYTGTGREWIEKEMGWEVEVVRHAPRPRGMWVWPGMEITEEMLAAFRRPKGFRHLPRRWVVENTQSQYP